MEISTQPVDHLILLVGSNPLPNAVAAQVLVKPGGHIDLAHSRSLGNSDNPVQERLKDWLERQGYKACLWEIGDESDPLQIRHTIEQILAEASGSVGLNYTGGTKNMSVHAYRAVREWATSGRDVRFSYLDARKLRMVFDHGAWISVGDVEIALKDMVALHGRTVDSDEQETRLPETAEALAHAFTDRDSQDQWNDWILESLFPRARKWVEDRSRAIKLSAEDTEVIRSAWFPGNKWLARTPLRAIDLPLPEGEALAAVVSALQRETNQETVFNLGQAADSARFREPKKLCEWLDGVWLEHWVFQAFQRCREELGLSYVGLGLNLDARGDNPNANFEFDVAAVRGYQLFACSCTVSTVRSPCKQKLFEVFLRARQLGGDEARIALVCCVDDPKGLEKEVARDIDPEGRIRVFGARDLPHLPEKLHDWIKQQSQGG